METTQKMAIAGSGMVLAAIGLGIVGTALIAPAVFGWTARLVEKGADGMAFGELHSGAKGLVGPVTRLPHRLVSADLARRSASILA